MDYFIVELNDEQKIAIPLDKVQEIMSINPNNICPIPGVKNGLLGVVTQRGNLLWLLDLSQLLLGVQSLTNKFYSLTILVTKLEKNYIGLVISKLGEIKNYLDVNKNFNFAQVNINNDYCEALIKDDEKSITIVDLIKIQKYLK